jgi:nitroimidazol reductase NimA-like FMN-containing flavoprotein (pyridoxamine 5'-phosphate oxidase superfamily)
MSFSQVGRRSNLTTEAPQRRRRTGLRGMSEREINGGPEPTDDELEAIARAILDANSYMTLGTADETGRPWVSPVWYAMGGYAELFWVSDPEARHSRNIAARPELAIVVFDSRAPVGSGQAVYMSAVGTELAGAELERGIEIFSDTSMADGARAWRREEVQPPAPHRLYRAIVSEHYVLDTARRSDRRLRVDL